VLCSYSRITKRKNLSKINLWFDFALYKLTACDEGSLINLEHYQEQNNIKHWKHLGWAFSYQLYNLVRLTPWNITFCFNYLFRFTRYLVSQNNLINLTLIEFIHIVFSLNSSIGSIQCYQERKITNHSLNEPRKVVQFCKACSEAFFTTENGDGIEHEKIRAWTLFESSNALRTYNQWSRKYQWLHVHYWLSFASFCRSWNSCSGHWKLLRMRCGFLQLKRPKYNRGLIDNTLILWLTK